MGTTPPAAEIMSDVCTIMQSEDQGRRPSINLYQSVDEDHPDLQVVMGMMVMMMLITMTELQSIQSVVANMDFSAD